MSLAFLTLSLLCVRPARAQGSYPGSGSGGGYPGGSGYPGGGPTPDPGHYWKITYTQTGTWSYTRYDSYTSTRTPQSGSWDTLTAPNNTSGGGDGHGYSSVLSGLTDGTVTATLTWVPAAGNPADPPSSPVHIKEYAKASWAAAWDTNGSSTPSDADYTGTGADDGLGDPVVHGTSQGSHLIQRDGSSGTIVLTCSLYAHNPASVWKAGGYPGGGSGGGYPGGSGYGYWTWTGGGLITTNFDVAVVDDNRAVTITSSIDPTYHKGSATTNNGSPQPMPDVLDATGTINANTLKPTSHSNLASDGTSVTISYYAHPAGSWAANSSYHWNIVEGDGLTNPTDGTFTMPDDPPYSEGTNYYLDSIIGGPEHVYIHLTDAVDSTDATANYYVNWHDPVEKWHPNGSSFSMPPTPYGDSKFSEAAGGQNTVGIDVPPGKISATAADKVLGGVMTVGATVIAVAAPETDPILIGLVTAAGYTLSVEPDPADKSYIIPGPESQFEADVATQVAINNGNTSGVFRPDLPRMDPGLATAISQSGDYVNYFNGKYGTMSSGVQIFQLRWSQNYLGDGYGIHGYTGDATGVVNWPGAIPTEDYVFNWTKVTSPSP